MAKLDVDPDEGEDPDAFAVLQARRDIEKREAGVKAQEEALAAERVKFDADRTVASKAQREQLAASIAKEHGIAPELLLKFTDGSDAAMRDLASQLPKATPPPPLTPDSGRSSGGGRTAAQIMDAYIQSPTEENRKAYEAIRTGRGR